MNVLMESFLRNRGYDADVLLRMAVCDHDLPEQIPEMSAALDIYRLTQQQLVVLTDVDVDGIMSGVIAYAGLSELGFNVALYMPDTHAYGFDEGTISDIRAKYPHAVGILTGDVGITAYDGIRYARASGFDVFVTDHHMGSRPVDANFVVDPQADTRSNSYGSICGAHVMWLLLRYYAEHFSPVPAYAVSQIERLRVFAGIGTVSDSMPMYHENRPLVKDAVSICRMLYTGDASDFTLANNIAGCDVYRRAFVGLAVVIDEFIRHKKLRKVGDIDETFFGYYVAPAFNSIKRMSGDIMTAYMVFFGGFDAAVKHVGKVLALNEERKQTVEMYFDECLSSVQPYAPYIYVTSAPSGLRGLLAQRLTAYSDGPVFVVCETDSGSYTGSGRSPSWFPFLDETRALRDGDAAQQSLFFDVEESSVDASSSNMSLPWWCAGHNAAFGVGICDDAGMDALYTFVTKRIKDLMPADVDVADVDYTVSAFGDGDSGFNIGVIKDFLYQTDDMRPFGSGFPAPVGRFLVDKRDCTFRLMGQDLNHLRISLPGGLNIVCFNQGKDLPQRDTGNVFGDVIEIIGFLCWNEWNDTVSVQIQGQICDSSYVSDFIAGGDTLA